mgnify:CR=1 FL=1
MSEIIRGERIYLRPMTIEDSSIVVSWGNSERVLKWMFSQTKISINSHISWFKSRKSRIDYMIIECLTDTPIGTLNFIFKENSSAEAGKLIGNVEFLGKGYAKEAFSLWVKYGFKSLNLKSIYILTKSTNQNNIILNEKIGFKKSLKLKNNGVDTIKMEIIND